MVETTDSKGATVELFQSKPEPHKEYEFTFTFDVGDSRHVLKAPVSFPFEGTTEEFAYRLIASHNIPCYVHRELFSSLHSFVERKTSEFNRDVHSLILNDLKEGNTKSRLHGEWMQALSPNKSNGVEAQQTFDNAWSDVYHSLIHSPALEALLQLEHSYAVAMKDLVKQKNDQLNELRDRHMAEMEDTVSMVGAGKTDTDVNNLTAKHLEESQMQEIYWSSEISELQETQKREYRQWVVTVHEKTIADESFNASDVKSQRVRSPSIESYQLNNFEVVTSAQDDFLQESFTIYLGNQMKSMHNIQLVCRDVLEFCRWKTMFVGGNMVPSPQRLQTAMTLYSENLLGLILFVDDRFNSSYSIKNKFQDICNESTEFHFQNIDKQMCLIEHNLQNKATRTRSLRSTSQSNDEKIEKRKGLLQTGDFYITKHSNLSEVHSVFHLVTDESVATQNINSRHPIMTGVRNIILTAARHNVSNLIIPLLLVHEMSENLTVQWCMKRAELVFKCVKGFMMESLAWDRSESRTLQFVVPWGISEEMFSAFSAMLPNIFRVSNTLDLSKLTS